MVRWAEVQAISQ